MCTSAWSVSAHAAADFLPSLTAACACKHGRRSGCWRGLSLLCTSLQPATDRHPSVKSLPPAAVNFNDFKDPEDVLPLTHEAVGIPRRIAEETTARMQVRRVLLLAWCRSLHWQ